MGFLGLEFRVLLLKGVVDPPSVGRRIAPL